MRRSAILAALVAVLLLTVSSVASACELTCGLRTAFGGCPQKLAQAAGQTCRMVSGSRPSTRTEKRQSHQVKLRLKVSGVCGHGACHAASYPLDVQRGPAANTDAQHGWQSLTALLRGTSQLHAATLEVAPPCAAALPPLSVPPLPANLRV